MKLKRLTATMLALLLMVSLLPMAAMATDNADNNATISTPIDTNTGRNVTVTETGSIRTNEGQVNNNEGKVWNNNNTVKTNEGNVGTNNGTVETNTDTGLVAGNEGTVKTNNGTVWTNHSAGTIETNDGTVGDPQRPYTGNSGTIETNNGTVLINQNIGTVENNASGGIVSVNYGLVGKKDENGNLITGDSSGNSGTVENNMTGGIVVNNNAGGYVENNGGTVVSNNARGIVENNGGTVVNNNAGGAVANNAGGKVENNSSTVYNEGGTVAINNPRGYVYGDDKESIGTNYGTRVFWNGDVSSSPEYFYGVHFVNDKDEMVYLGDYQSNDPVTLEQLQTNCKGYKIYGILAVEEYNKGADDFIQRVPEANESNRFTIKNPTRLTLLWEKIASVFKPAASTDSTPEAKPVKAAALPSTVAAEDVKVGTVVWVKGQLFRVIEMDDGSMTVVTMGKLSKKDMEDLMAFLAKYFTPEQIELLLGDPELISGALAEELFGGNTGHIVFKAARNLFA